MKKILLYICTLLVMAGCTDESAVMQPDALLPEGKVALNFAVNVPDIPQATRTFAEPAVSSLHLIVFDENGYLVEKVEAQPTTSLDYSTTDQIGFTATLTANAAKRTIHFVANYANAMALPFGSESDVIGGIKHSNGQDAYWQCKELTEGVNEDTQLGCIPLIHNFAKITVVNHADDFELTGFTVVNTVTEGYISPYNMNTGNFAKFIEMDGNNFIGAGTATFVCREYKDITFGATGYEGYVPGTAELNLNTAIPAEANWIDFTDGNTANDAFYMYERSFETNDHTFVLVKGKYLGSSDESYYKIDLIYKDESNMTQYYNILRNFNYQITLTDVSGAGKDSPEDAYNMMGAHNNLTSSVETQQLTNISDGHSVLNVSYTSEYIVSEVPVTLYYKFIPEAKTSPNTANNNEISANGAGSPVTVKWEEGDVIQSLTVSSADEEEEGSVHKGWRCITLTPQAIDKDENKVQTITIVAGNLSRTVTYILRSPYEMTAKCNNPVEEGIGKEVIVTTSIPTKLPEVLFPLSFYIVAESRTLYPNSSMNQLPLEIIPNSLITPGEDYYTFGFVYTLSYDEYLAIGGNSADATVSFKTQYLTNTAASASVVHVYNQYFKMAETKFINGAPDIKNATITGTATYGNETPTLQFTAATAGTYTISFSDGTTETVTLAANGTYSKAFSNPTWSKTASATVSVTVAGTLREYTVDGAKRNKLNMKAASTSASDGSLTNATTFSIFTSEADAKTMNNALGTVTNSTLKTTTGATLQRDNLKETDLIWFAYTNGDYLYYASTTAKALSDGTATLAFDRIAMPTIINEITLDGEEYYGTGKPVTIKFRTNKAGTYTIKVTEGSNVYTHSTSYSAVAGVNTINYQTKNFNGDISVEIIYNSDGTSGTGSGVKRNVLSIPRRQVTGNNINGRTVTIASYSYNGTTTSVNTNLSNTIVREGSRYYIVAEDVTIDNIPSGDAQFTLQYTRNNRTYKTTVTAQNLLTGTGTLEFTQ